MHLRTSAFNHLAGQIPSWCIISAPVTAAGQSVINYLLSSSCILPLSWVYAKYPCILNNASRSPRPSSFIPQLLNTSFWCLAVVFLCDHLHPVHRFWTPGPGFVTLLSLPCLTAIPGTVFFLLNAFGHHIIKDCAETFEFFQKTKDKNTCLT